MERRLIHLSGMSSPERPMGARGLERADALPAVDRLNSHREGIEQDRMRYVLDRAREPAELEREILEDFGSEMIGRMGEVSGHYRTLIEGQGGIRTRLYASPRPGVSAAHFGQHEQELEGILDAIVSVPAAGETTPEPHRYLESKPFVGQYITFEDDIPLYYTTRFSQIDQDRALLESLKTSHPQHAEDLTTLSNALEELARQDKRYPTYRYAEGRVSFTDESAKKMGRATVFLVASAAAVIAGIIAMVNKKSFLPPLLFAGVAVFAAKPRLWQTIFGSQSENVRYETDSILNDGTFKRVSNNYGIRGPVWRTIAENIMDGDSETTALITLLKSNKHDPEAMQREIDAYVKGTVPGGERGNKGVSESFRRLIEDGYLPWLVATLTSAKSQDAREIILDYINLDSAQYAQADEAVEQAEDLQAAEEAMENPETPAA